MHEQNPDHPILRYLADAFSLGRMGYSGKQAWELRATMPEERTWLDAGKTALAAVFDAIDGFSARRYGSTTHGGELDRAADVTFFTLGNLALSSNGEISGIHPTIDLVREVGVNSMRILAKANGQPPIKVGMRGKEKTAMKMVALTLARSPLSKHNGLVESTTAFGSAMSLLSGAEYGYQYFQGLRGQRNETREETDTSRNGAARKATENNYGKIANWLNQTFPGIRPDTITRVGELMVLASGFSTLTKPELGFVLGAGPYTIGSLLDGVDGNLARLQGTDDIQGMINDARADKRQEISTAAFNSLLAGNKGYSVAAYHYAAAASTAALPALFRSIAETRGFIVNEDAIGSRVARSIEGGIGFGFNRYRQISDINSSLMVVGNLVTAAQRADVAARGKKSPHYRGQNNDPEFINRAKIRRDALLPIAAGGMLVGMALAAREKTSFLKPKPEF